MTVAALPLYTNERCFYIPFSLRGIYFITLLYFTLLTIYSMCYYRAQGRECKYMSVATRDLIKLEKEHAVRGGSPLEPPLHAV